ncbi:MAG: GGDEF domain-containing protein [bacterium]
MLKLSKIKQIILFIILLVISIAVFLFDIYLTNDEIRLLLPYIIIIYFSVWYLGSKTGIFFSLLAILFWSIAYINSIGDHNINNIFNVIIKIFFIGIQYFIINNSRRIFLDNEKLAQTDSLTGIMNRRAFYNMLTYEIEKAKRENSILSLVFIDLDNFKNINDTFGHKTGDDLLKIFCSEVKNMIRTTDAFGRMGGDEFAILLPKNNGSETSLFVKRIQDRIIPIFMDNHWDVTLSIGVITTDKPVDVDDLIHQADTLMYKVKNKGKNNIEYKNL